MTSALTGLWAAAWTALPALVYLPLQEPVRTEALQSLAIAAHLLSGRLISPSVEALWWAPMLAFALASAGAALTLLAAHALDRSSESSRALRWSLRTWPTLLVWSAALLTALCLMVMLSNPFLILILAISACTLPFLALRTDIIALDRPPLLWMPAWPGLAPPALGASVLVVLSALGAVVDARLSMSLATSIAADIAMCVVSAIGMGWVLIAWRRRSRANALRHDLRDALRPESVRTMVAVSLRVGLSIGLLAVPIAVVALDQTLIQPQVLFMFDASAMAAPRLLSFYAHVGAAVSGWWWAPLAIVSAWIFCTSAARSLWQISARVAAATN